MLHRSAGWTRSSPTSSSTSRYCGNSATDETVLPAITRSRIVGRARSRRARSLAPRPRCSASGSLDEALDRELHRTQHQGRRRASPTISSAPTAWCSCWRAMRSWLRVDRRQSEPRASRHRARSGAASWPTPSSDLRSSPAPRPAGPRSLVAGRDRAGWLAGRWRGFGATRRALGVQAILNRDTDWRSSSAMCDSSRTCCGGGPRAFAGLLGHGKDVLDVGRHHVGRIGFAGGRLRDLLDQLGQPARHRSISASAVPALSDSFAPSTTPWVERSMAPTASWVSV